MARRVTVSDVARAAGVSPTTVSHALSGKGRVDPDTRERVVGLAREMGYVPSRVARSLALGRSDTIGLLLPHLSDMPLEELLRTDWYSRVAVAATRSAVAHRRALMVLPTARSGAEIDAHGLEGLIVLDPVADDPRWPALRETSTPLVLLGGYSGDDMGPSVAPDTALGMGLLLDHLREQGARTVAVVATDIDWVSGEESLAAYRRWCRTHRVKARVATAAVGGSATAEGIAEAAFDAATRLLAPADRPDAIVGLLEDFGRGIIAAARARGLEVPRDLLVAQDIDGTGAALHDPPITALDLDVDTQLTMAIELIESGSAAGASATRRVPVRLVQRASTLHRPSS